MLWCALQRRNMMSSCTGLDPLPGRSSSEKLLGTRIFGDSLIIKEWQSKKMFMCNQARAESKIWI